MALEFDTFEPSGNMRQGLTGMIAVLSLLLVNCDRAAKSPRASMAIRAIGVALLAFSVDFSHLISG
jgi:hypothetical protein